MALERVSDRADCPGEGLHSGNDVFVRLSGFRLGDEGLQLTCQFLHGLTVEDGPGSSLGEHYDLSHVVDDLGAVVRETTEAVVQAFEALLDIERGAHRMMMCHGNVG